MEFEDRIYNLRCNEILLHSFKTTSIQNIEAKGTFCTKYSVC